MKKVLSCLILIALIFGLCSIFSSSSHAKIFKSSINTLIQQDPDPDDPEPTPEPDEDPDPTPYPDDNPDPDDSED